MWNFKLERDVTFVKPKCILHLASSICLEIYLLNILAFGFIFMFHYPLVKNIYLYIIALWLITSYIIIAKTLNEILIMKERKNT